MTRLGVIPAAGKGSRWGGYYKELLPCGSGEWLLDRTVKAMVNGGADAVLIVTTPDKVATHAAHMNGRSDVPVFYAMQTGSNDIWSAIEESFNYPADDYLFAMPDTYYPLDAFATKPDNHAFKMGLFETGTPERFGVYDWDSGTVINKQRDWGVYSNKPYWRWSAWGLLYWNRRIRELWQSLPLTDYTEAINAAVDLVDVGHMTWNLGYYHDFATWEDYAGWIAGKDEAAVALQDVFGRYVATVG